MHEFSLFEGDTLNRLLAKIGIKSRGAWSIVSRVLLLLGITWLPTTILALWEGWGPGQPRLLNFFGDLGAWGQAFLGYPLFVIAESIISSKTRGAAKHFMHSGVVLPESLDELNGLHERLAKARRSVLPDIICLILGFAFAMFWLYEETHNASNTWHAIGAPGVQTPTYTGLWVAFVGIPIFNYWWLRWFWKVTLWCRYIYGTSRLRLRLIASHPDLTGGLSFVSEAQTSFAILIFAFGIGIIAPLIGYKIEIEHADWATFSVAGPLLGFIIGAPLFFTIPLLMFTKQLARTKKRALDAYQERATEASLFFEEKWLNQCHGGDCEVLFGDYLRGMNSLNTAYEHVKGMRVVPFDVKSFTQLFGSTLGSLLPIVFKVFEIPEPVTKFYELIKPIFGGH